MNFSLHVGRWRLFAGFCCALFAVVALGQTAVSRRAFDIPAGEADRTLRQFSTQSGVQVVFPSTVVEGVRTNPVRGELAVDDALEQLLAGTPLVAVREAGRAALTIRRETDAEKAEKNVGSRRGAEVATAGEDRDTGRSRIRDGVVELEEYPVTGTRIRTLGGEQTIQPALTLTNREIERTGISSLGEIFRYIPQVTSSATGQLVQTTNRFGSESATLTATRVTATLRGSPPGGTLLLVNGRRVPKTGQETGADAYDLSGIPISAIERIEVLLDGASAVYGADAVGGVINVILKKNYRGTELHLNYENTFDTDVGVKTASLSHGFASDKLSGAITFSWEEANEMMWRDRWFLKTFDRRPFGGDDLREGVGGRGQIRAVSGNLPGLTTNRVGIPAGSDGVNVTVQNYANAPLPPTIDFGETSAYSTPYRRRNAVANVEYAWRDWLRPFADVRASASETTSSQVASYGVVNLQIPAGAPGNPFGVPVILSKTFFDVPPPTRAASSRQLAVSAGLRGDLPRSWRYESTANVVRAYPGVEVAPTTLSAARVAQAFASGQRLILLHDSTSGLVPNPPGTLEALAVGNSVSAERAETWTYDVQADGPLGTLWAGEVRAAAGAEYREEYVDFPYQPTTSTNARSRNRYTSGYFAELNVPLLARAQNVPLVERLELRLAARHDRYTDVAADTNPNVGLLYRPTPWLILRGSYGKGYKVPTLSQLYASPSSTSVFYFIGSPAFLDAARGNEPVVYDEEAGLPVLRGGNPLLRPERSENITAGLVLDMPGVRGLSFAAGYFSTEYIDRAGSLSLTDRIQLFPETVTRGPRRPGDPAGWPGPVTGYQEIPLNVAFEKIAGWDASAKYSVATRWGEINAQVAASRVIEREVRAAAHLAPTLVSTAASLPLQASGSLFWTRGPYDVGALFSFRDGFRGFVNSTYTTPSAIRWDAQASYNFSESEWLRRRGHWWRRVFGDTRIRVTIFNVLNEVPPFAQSTLPDNSVVDSRLRRYAVSLTKRF